MHCVIVKVKIRGRKCSFKREMIMTILGSMGQYNNMIINSHLPKMLALLQFSNII